MMRPCLSLFLGILLSTGLEAQTEYTTLHFSSAHNCFPDTARDGGHLDGDSILQPRAGHYDDSSVLLIAPAGMQGSKTIDLIFWFHGWHNNIDTAVQFYGLARQLVASHCNAVLVLPEAAKNAADSYSGKLRQQGMFRLLVTDVVEELKRKGLAPQNAVAGHVILAGHSGAYLVIADILEHGQQAVDEVFLFDALYGHVDTYTRWAEEDKHHFVHWFTNTGYGPDRMSDTMMLRLRQDRTSYGLCEEPSVDDRVLRENPVLFIHSARKHNDIINNPDDLALLLKNSFFLTQPYANPKHNRPAKSQ